MNPAHHRDYLAACKKFQLLILTVVWFLTTWVPNSQASLTLRFLEGKVGCSDLGATIGQQPSTKHWALEENYFP